MHISYNGNLNQHSYLVCVEQLKNLNPSSIVMKLILVRLDLKLKSTTAVSSVLVISH